MGKFCESFLRQICCMINVGDTHQIIVIFTKTLKIPKNLTAKQPMTILTTHDRLAQLDWHQTSETVVLSSIQTTRNFIFRKKVSKINPCQFEKKISRDQNLGCRQFSNQFSFTIHISDRSKSGFLLLYRSDSIQGSDYIAIFLSLISLFSGHHLEV